jgi:hypothetical protein
MTFEELYKNVLEKTAVGTAGDDLDPEAMLDDFEYTLIRPYANEGEKEIKHKPYIGMDRISRLEYLTRLTKETPSNYVEMYTEKYKNGELSIEQMKSDFLLDGAEQKRYIKLAGCIQALENVNNSRPLVWRAMHVFKHNEEKTNSALMKKEFIEKARGGEEFYRKAAAAANECFESRRIINERLEQSMIYAREELNRQEKLNNAIREAIRIDEFEKDFDHAVSPRVDQHKSPEREMKF